MKLDHIDGLLLDMDGVLGVSWRPLPGAADAVTRLHSGHAVLWVESGQRARDLVQASKQAGGVGATAAAAA